MLCPASRSAFHLLAHWLLSHARPAGEGIELVHEVATYSRALEATFRGGSDFTLQDDVPKFRTSLKEALDQFEHIHQVGELPSMSG